MRFYAYHGTYAAERKIGTDYLVDVYVQASIGAAAATDQVSATINYETIYRICEIEMEQPRNLIETVLTGIFTRMKQQCAGMNSLKVRVRKLQPPLGGRVEWSSVEDEEQYSSSCPRCGRGFIDYKINDCWDRAPNLFPATKEALLKQFGGKCLCENCLKFYAG